MIPELTPQNYPRHVHQPSVPGEWVFKVVTTPEECAQALQEGWSLTPILRGQEPVPAPVPDPEPVPVTPVAPLRGRRGSKS